MKFNTVLGPEAQRQHAFAVEELHLLAPEIMKRKIPGAYIQHAWTLDAIQDLYYSKANPEEVLCIGSFDDPVYEALQLFQYYHVKGIDPVIDGVDLDRHYLHCMGSGQRYHTIFATSVLEHVQFDFQFLEEIVGLLHYKGYGLLTVDYKNDWQKGDRLPTTSLRFYRQQDLERIRTFLTDRGCELIDGMDWNTDSHNFEWEAIHYSFATIGFIKSIKI